MATLSSSIDLRSQTYQANSAVYDGLLKTLRTRQAWSLADPLQDHTEEYDSDWLTDVRKIGAENYYPPVAL